MHAALDVGNIWKHLRAGEGCNPCPAHLEPPSCNPSGEERLRDETALPRQVRKARAHDGPGVAPERGARGGSRLRLTHGDGDGRATAFGRRDPRAFRLPAALPSPACGVRLFSPFHGIPRLYRAPVSVAQ